MKTRRINICDNSQCSLAELEIRVSEEEDIRFLSDTTISDMADKRKENLLVFPHCLNANHKDLNGGDKVITLSSDRIQTHNYMGFIGRGNVELHITSRFDKGRDNFFMHYMLQKVFSVNIFDLKVGSDNSSVWDFLIYLFPYYLKRALRQGLYKEYRWDSYNDAKLKGSIDVSRHIRCNIPFNGKVAYNTREYSYDNDLMQLVRHTIEYISCHPIGGSRFLKANKENLEAVEKIISVTSSYQKSERRRIISVNQKTLRNPFFADYIPLQNLCLKILRRDKLSFGAKEDQIYGLLFDGAWLWEEYLATLLKEMGFTHPDNRNMKDPIYLFKESSTRANNSRNAYPDFYKEDLVLDAKYKSLSKGVTRDDLYQIITYMHCMRYSKGGFIYPLSSEFKNQEPYFATLSGHGGDLYLYPFQVSAANNFKEFIQRMQEEEHNLQRII